MGRRFLSGFNCLCPCLLPAVIALTLTSITRVVRRNWPIVLTLTGLALFSVSNRVNFLGATLITFPLPSALGSILGMARTAGRNSFWPVGYAILAIPFVIVVRRMPRIATPLVLCAVVIACVEASGSYEFVRQTVTTEVAKPLANDELERQMARHSSLFVFPTYWCNSLTHNRIIAYQQIELASARKSLPSNSTITARKIKDCDRELATGVPPLDGKRLVVLMDKGSRAERSSHRQAQRVFSALQCNSHERRFNFSVFIAH